MAIAYIRPNKHFSSVVDQLKLIKSYAYANNIEITDKLIEQTGGSNKEAMRIKATEFFRSHTNGTLLVADVWVLGENVEEIVQSFICLFKNDLKVHIVEKSAVVTKNSNTIFVLGLLDTVRQMLQERKSKKLGRPKGSRSASKFDVYLEEIMNYIQEGKSVSEIARLLEISRSSLKDYIESRELKKIAKESFLLQKNKPKEQEVIHTLQCPDEAIERERNFNTNNKGGVDE